jgi:hypothetical protein
MRKAVFGLIILLVLGFVFLSSCESENGSFQTKNRKTENYNGLEIGKWHSKSTMVATGIGFEDTYQEIEFYSDGTVIIHNYEGDKIVEERKGSFYASNSTLVINESKYHGYAYEFRNGLLYLTAFDSSNRRVEFEPYYKID